MWSVPIAESPISHGRALDECDEVGELAKNVSGGASQACLTRVNGETLVGGNQ